MNEWMNEWNIFFLNEQLHSENNFETVLASLCCYDPIVKACKAVQKIVTDQKEYHKIYLYSQNIPISQ